MYVCTYIYKVRVNESRHTYVPKHTCVYIHTYSYTYKEGCWRARRK